MKSGQLRAAPAEDRVITRLSRSDGLTRRALADDLQLPTATVITVVSKLIADGVLTERTSTERRSTAGRNPQVLSLADRRPVLGVLAWSRGALHVWVATYSGVVLAHRVMAIGVTVADVSALDPALDFIRAGVDAANAGGDPARPNWLTGVVISVPAPFQPGSGLPLSRTRSEPTDRPEFAPWLRSDPGHPLAQRLSVPVLIENDANLAAVGEVSHGVAQGCEDVLYLKPGELSVGAGLVLSGSLYRGASGFAGEIAHIHVDDNGPLCACGGRGCLSSQLRAGPLESVQPAYAVPLQFADVLDMAAAGEPGPARIVKDYGRLIGRRVADLCTFLNPAMVVVGGGFGAATGLVVDGLREQIDLYAAPMASAAVRTVVSDLGLQAELLGAIEFARTELPVPAR